MYWLNATRNSRQKCNALFACLRGQSGREKERESVVFHGSADSSSFITVQRRCSQKRHSRWRETLRHLVTCFFFPGCPSKVVQLLRVHGYWHRRCDDTFPGIAAKSTTEMRRAEKALTDIERMKMLISFGFLIMYSTGSSTLNIFANTGIIVLVPILDWKPFL